MDLARWQEIKRLAQEALDLPLEEQAHFIATIPDEDLRPHVAALLAVSASQAEILENYRPFPRANFEMILREGDRVRGYTILRFLGRGGMGTVYLAKDEKHSRTVALKILLPRSFRPAAEEHRILARLSNPNIATLYDSGTTESGLRYVAMEHVEGSTITAYCEEHCPSVESRLELFLKVCGAVAYAHRHLVVHRDLKPSNVLVTSGGEPKLLDFGIAKVLPEVVAEATLTRPEDRSLTLAFASPEQLGAELTTTATDIYSLGVLLTLLLTGRLPYTVTSAYDLPWAIRNSEPEKPSDLIWQAEAPKEHAADSFLPLGSAPPETPRKLRNRLRGDLDAIALKALRKEPERRYSSVAEFAEDIRRHLADRPVAARSGSSRYRALKFMRRHRRSVALALLVFLLLAGSAVALIREEREIIRERDKARREALRAEGVSRFLIGMFAVSHPWTNTGENITAREVLDNGVMNMNAAPPRTPELRTTLRQALGKIYVNLGLYAPAEALLLPALHDLDSTRSEDRPRIAEVLSDLARLDYQHARYGESKQEAQRALALDADGSHRAGTLSLLGHVAFAEADFPRAEALFKQVADLSARSPEGGPARIASSLNDLGCALHEEGRLREAEELYIRALTARRKTFGAEHLETLQSLHNLAVLYEDQGKAKEAANLYRAIKAHGDRFEPYSLLTTSFLHGIASHLLTEGSYHEADLILGDLLAFRRRLLPDTHPDVARTLAEYGRLAHLKGQYREAESYYRDSLERLDRTLGPAHPDRTRIANNLAVLLAQTGRAAEAQALWRDVLTKSAAVSRPSIQEAARANLTVLLSRGREFRLLSTVQLSLTEPGRLVAVAPTPLPETTALPGGENIRFFDDFEGQAPDPRKWEYGGSSVTEENGQLRVMTSTTDLGGWARTLPIPIDPERTLTVTRRVKLHAANAYFDGSMALNITGYPEKRFGVSYANYHYTGGGECVTEGFSLFRFDANSHRFADRKQNASQLLPPVWDRWLQERLVYEPHTGEVQYFLDGTLRLTYNVGPLPPNASSVTLTFTTWGWYTGHYQYLDSLVVKQ